MKKLLTGLISLTSLAGVTTPLAFMTSCGNTPSSKFVDVTVASDVVEHVTLEKTQAEIGKRFETKVSFESTFYMNKVTVRVGDRILREGDLSLTIENEFFYDYLGNTLTIREGVIDAPVVLTFEFTYVFTDTVAYVPGHIPYLISSQDIYIEDSRHPYTFYLYIDFTCWPEFYKDQFPQYFCFSKDSDIKSNGTFASDDENKPQIWSILPDDQINVTLVDDGKGNPNKCFKLDGKGYGYGKGLKLLMFMQCTFDAVPNHYRFYGLNHQG